MKSCRGPCLDAFDLAALATLTLVSASVFAPILRAGLPLSGAFGLWPEDQLQYFAWIREAAHHLIIGNRFDLARTPRTFLDPAFAFSGLVHAATGLSIPLSFFLWQPAALLLLFAGYRAYVRRLATERAHRAIALWLALFAISPLFVALKLSGLAPPGLVREAFLYAYAAWTAGIFWGYPVTAVALALMPVVLLGLDSWRQTRRARTLWLICAAALLISWIHPWQGATLMLVIVTVEGLHYRRTGNAPLAGLLLVVGALLLPAVYYQLLTILDPVWKIYRMQNASPRRLLAPMLAFLPLAAPAALAYRLPAMSWQELAVRIWPLTALLVYLLPFGTYPVHAVEGVALPLGILAVQGVFSLRWRLPSSVVIGLVVGLMLLPGWAYNLFQLRTQLAGFKSRWYFTIPGEQSALAALEHDPRPGGVLASVWLGALVPSTTGREVYVGHDSWSPDFFGRERAVRDLFTGRLGEQAGQAFVRATRARFLLAGCGEQADLTSTLGPLLAAVRRYDCATVYELIERPSMAEAAGPPDE